VNCNQQEDPKHPPVQPDKPAQTLPDPPPPPKEPSHDPKVVVTETKRLTLTTCRSAASSRWLPLGALFLQTLINLCLRDRAPLFFLPELDHT